jgi:hypothetical protein
MAIAVVVSHLDFLKVGISYKKCGNADFRNFNFTNDDNERGDKPIE